MIARSRSRNSSAVGTSACSNSWSASTSAARIRLGFRPRHALVLQRVVQYLGVDRVSGNALPHQSATPILASPLTPAAKTLINGGEADAGWERFSASRFRSVDQRFFSFAAVQRTLCRRTVTLPRAVRQRVTFVRLPWWRNR